MFGFNLIVFTIIVIPYTVSYIRKYLLTPATVFLIMEISYFYGICFAPRGTEASAIKLETIYVVSLTCFILGIEFCKKTYLKKSVAKSCEGGGFKDNDATPLQYTVIGVVIIISVLLCLYLFAAGGTNLFLQSLNDFFHDSQSVYKKERAAFFSVGGMGYIYQFRAILLPVLSFYIAFCDRKKLPKYLGIPLIILMVIFLLGTGQRNAFVFFCLVIVMYCWYIKKEYGVTIFTKKQVIILGSCAILFLVVLTISNGRVDESSSDNIVIGALQSLIDRVFQVNQRTAITAFNYIDTQPTVWGYDWWMTMMDILPGKSGYLTVSRIVYHIAYGTYNGTGDPCIWGSAWYNFGVFGATLFPFILGIAYHHVYKHMITVKDKNRLYILIYSGLSVYLGLWIYGTPMNLFNIGVVALLFLRFVLFSAVPAYEKKHHHG